MNPLVIQPGHHVRVQITKRTGNILLIGPAGASCEQLDVKLDVAVHQIKGQKVLRVPIPSTRGWKRVSKWAARTF
jgi:hypothetical protein